MNGVIAMGLYKEKLAARIIDNTENVIENECLNLLYRDPSEKFIYLNTNALLTEFFDDELMPKNPEVYDRLCTAMVMNDNMKDYFTYEEIEYANREAFFEGCDTYDILAFMMILITEFIASNARSINGFMILNMYDGTDTALSADILAELAHYSRESTHEYYPAILALITDNVDITLERLDIIKNVLTVLKVEDMPVDNKRLANMALNEVDNLHTEGKIAYYGDKVLDTNNFKDSDMSFCRFLYHITRGTVELNSTTNIKAIFENIKDMIGEVSARTLNDWVRMFLATNPRVSNLMIPYLQRLAALNNAELEKEKDLVSVTFNYEDNELFTISKKKAA